MCDIKYPDKLLRGVPKKDLIQDGLPTTGLFNFDQNNDRGDNFAEMSINWYDDVEAINIIMNQKKDCGELQFKAGVVVLKKEEIDKIKQRKIWDDVFDYERSPLPENKYHGNLLLKKDFNKQHRKALCSTLAMYFDEYIESQ